MPGSTLVIIPLNMPIITCGNTIVPHFNLRQNLGSFCPKLPKPIERLTLSTGDFRQKIMSHAGKTLGKVTVFTNSQGLFVCVLWNHSAFFPPECAHKAWLISCAVQLLCGQTSPNSAARRRSMSAYRA